MIGCPDCAQLTGGDCGAHGPQYTPTFGTTLIMAPPLGWRCPCCQAVYSPSVTECWRCSPPALAMLNGGHACAPNVDADIRKGSADE